MGSNNIIYNENSVRFVYWKNCLILRLLYKQVTFRIKITYCDINSVPLIEVLLANIFVLNMTYYYANPTLFASKGKQ